MTPEAPLTIAPFDGEAAEWDRFVAGPPEGTFCHLAGWREIMDDVLGHECLYTVACDQAGAWQGVLPLVRVRSRLFGHYLLSMPFLNGGGPLGTPAAQVRLAHQALAHAQGLRVDFLELRARHATSAGLHCSNRKITVRLELPPTTDDLWRGFVPKLRSQIRRPQKEGMEVRFGHDQIGPFYEVFARNMRDLGTPVLPQRLFERVAAICGDRVLCGVIYWRAQPVAAGLGFLWRNEFELTWAAARREHNSKAPNMLLYWAFLEETLRRGVRWFDFGRCTSGSGTHLFKRQWGGQDTPLPWLEWSRATDTRIPSPERPLYLAARSFWRHLPLPVANRLGPPLARFLP